MCNTASFPWRDATSDRRALRSSKKPLVHAFMVQQQKFGCPGSADESTVYASWHGMAWGHGHGGRRPSSGATLDTCTDDDDDDGTFITPHYSNNFPAARPSSSRHWTCTAPHAHRSARCARPRSPGAKLEWHTVSFFSHLLVLFLNVEANIAQHSNTQSRFNITVLEYCPQVTSH